MHYKSIRSLLVYCFLGLTVLLMTACGLQATSAASATLLSATTKPPSVTTLQNCPGQGQGRAAVMPALTTPQHQSVVYLWQKNTNAIVRRYDPLTGNKKDLFTFPNPYNNAAANVSPDGHWIIINRPAEGGGYVIQLVRIDGAYAQTLYCSSSSDFLSGVIISPNQHYLVFNEKNQNTLTDTLNLLDMTTGKIQTILSSLQPGYPGASAQQQAPNRLSVRANNQQQPLGEMRYASLFMPQGGPAPITAYIPLKWASNSSLYLLGVPVVVGSGSLPHQLYQLLDIKKPVDQQSTNLKSLTALLKQDGCQSYDITPDHRQLICSSYPMFGGDPTAPAVNVESISGGSLHPIFIAPTGSQVFARAPRAQTILFIVNTIPTHVSQLYRINVNGTGLKLLASSKASEYFYDPDSYLPWTNVSRDGKHYVIRGRGSNDGTNTLVIGDLNGGSPTTVSTETPEFIVGWTAV
ncbi:hypothetical protein [Dictyobacter formicarum]|uniref:Lipoprotein LpqB beta-propeller domain-containing protein n=1 Tax=Dictyobacter formicarum TaxID=2778368 RepID=A0ABQ3VP17_9CHLR|nr:hypothetical protein [Dictyobacter formicarum]GHO87987.1 hypothetical protein KSZ_59930 [Dictyobacter formicarum]